MDVTTPLTPSLLSWSFSPESRCHDIVILVWEDEHAVRRRTVLTVDYDIDGASFFYESGDALDPKNEDYEDLIYTLDGDMADLRGSEFIPIRPHYYKKAV